VQLIDPYWTIIPVLIAHFFAAHPAGTHHTTGLEGCMEPVLSVLSDD
jgi:hypothetical protein